MAYLDLNDSIIAQVRDAADLVDIVSQVTPLKPAGSSHKGLCPFHREKTPSFNVNRAKGFFYCFGCGTGGDVFKFLTLTERVTFPEAVEMVATRVGISLPKKSRTSSDRGKDELLRLVEDAAEAFHQALGWTPNPAAEYLRARGVEESIWDKYGFGYAPDSWDYILTRLGRKYPAEQIEAAGLIRPRERGGGHYDRFRNRLIVPIHSESGTVIGFGGRSLDGTDPKYLNSPESAIFNKSHLLYNLHRARAHIRKLERAVLVEGYFDCITLDHGGVDGVVASMGTSLTPGQAALLRRSATRVILCYDGDEAGQNAMLRAAPVLLSAGLQVQIAQLREGEDPDGFLRTHGFDRLMEVLGNAVDLFEFALGRKVRDAARMSSADKREVLTALSPLLASVSDPVQRNDAAQRIADRLRLEFQTVWSSVRTRFGQAATSSSGSPAPIATGEKQLLRALLRGKVQDGLIGKLSGDHFEDGPCRAIFEVARDRDEQGQALDFLGIATHLKGEAELTRLAELAFDDEGTAADVASLERTILLMERRLWERRLRNLQAEIQEAEMAGDEERQESLSIEKMNLSRRLHGLK